MLNYDQKELEKAREKSGGFREAMNLRNHQKIPKKKPLDLDPVWL